MIPETSRMRVGTGYDIHPLKPGGKLKIGGIVIEYPFSFDGHSDGDVVMHAVCDAMLGGAGMGDIGEFFPDTDPAFCGADSSVLLRRVSELLVEAGYRVLNLDITLVIEAPRVAPFRAQITEKISEQINADPERVNIKFKTAEGLGPVGRGEAGECHAIVSLQKL